MWIRDVDVAHREMDAVIRDSERKLVLNGVLFLFFLVVVLQSF